MPTKRSAAVPLMFGSPGAVPMLIANVSSTMLNEPPPGSCCTVPHEPVSGYVCGAATHVMVRSFVTEPPFVMPVYVSPACVQPFGIVDRAIVPFPVGTVFVYV